VLPGSPAVVEAAGSFTTAELAGMIENPGYMPLGLPALRCEVAALLTRAGLPTTDGEVMITTGAQQAINLVASVLVRNGDEVLVENPSFSGCLDALRAAGARLVPVPMDSDGIDVDAVAGALDRTSPVALYLMPTYHNPTGALLSEPRRRRLARLSAERGLVVIEDNALEHARFGREMPPRAVASFDAGAPVLTLGSLSMVLWAGLRVGWVRASEPMIARLVHAKAVHDLGSPVLPQAVAARLLPRLEEIGGERGKEQGEHVAHAIRLLRRHLPGWSWQPPAGGLALWVRLPGGDGDEFAQVALRHGVEVVPGATMSPDGSFAEHLRLAVIEPELLDEAFARLGRAWAAYAPSSPARSDVRVIV
ncbi:MAG: PLP-dependent aminotransferase family protein, partial [Acidimicrobiales bacterium]